MTLRFKALCGTAMDKRVVYHQVRDLFVNIWGVFILDLDFNLKTREALLLEVLQYI